MDEYRRTFYSDLSEQITNNIQYRHHQCKILGKIYFDRF